MTIGSNGYAPGKPTEQKTVDLQRVIRHLDLILANENNILGCRDYFFVVLACAWCSWLYVSGDGPLYLGYLLLGWRDQRLTEPCPCGGQTLLLRFSGSPLSGRQSWVGVCRRCRTIQSGGNPAQRPFGTRFQLVRTLRSRYPAEIGIWEEFDGHEFTWGGSGLQPARRKRLIRQPTADPVTFDQLLLELLNHRMRSSNPPRVARLNEPLRLKFG